MSASSNKLVEVGVVLQGGGALGAYECGALNALLELMDEFEAQGRRIALKVVTGVSIGSINAACVVGAKSNADARAPQRAVGRFDAGNAAVLDPRRPARPRLFRTAGLLCATAGFLDRSDLDLCL